MTRRLFLFSMAGLFLFTLLLHWTTFNLPFIRDEGEYAYTAWRMGQGDLPYQQIFLQKPPMIIYTYALAQIIDPVACWPPRVLAALAVFLAAVLIGLAAKKEFGPLTGNLAPAAAGPAARIGAGSRQYRKIHAAASDRDSGCMCLKSRQGRTLDLFLGRNTGIDRAIIQANGITSCFVFARGLRSYQEH